MALKAEPAVPSGKSIEWQAPFRNLPLMFSFKNDVRKAFRDYTSTVVYDLSVYQSLFDRFDAEAASAPAVEKQALWDHMLAEEGRKFIDFFYQTLEELKQEVADFGETEHQRHGYFFRRQNWISILSNPFLTRCNLKPRGYPGDSELMQMIYRNDFEGDSTFGRLLHKACVELPCAQSVRDRKQMLIDSIKAFSEQKSGNGGKPMRVLSIACGPAFELFDLMTSPEDCRKYEFSLLDQDKKAILEAGAVASQLTENLGQKVSVSFINASVRSMLINRNLTEEWGRFDFIYALGLFDYLNQPAAQSLFKIMLQLLNPGGEILLGNYHVGNVVRVPMAYWADWMLIYRTEKELQEIVPERNGFDYNLNLDPTKCQMILHLRKT